MNGRPAEDASLGCWAQASAGALREVASVLPASGSWAVAKVEGWRAAGWGQWASAEEEGCLAVAAAEEAAARNHHAAA